MSETHGMIDPPDVGECCLAAFSRASSRRPVIYTFAPLAANDCAALLSYQYSYSYSSRLEKAGTGKLHQSYACSSACDHADVVLHGEEILGAELICTNHFV